MAVAYNPGIVTDGLVLCLDAANRKSYPGTGTGWNDIITNNFGTLNNGTTFNLNNNGSIVFDGTDDNVSCSANSSLSFGTGNFTIDIFVRMAVVTGNQYFYDFGTNSVVVQYVGGVIRYLTQATSIKDTTFTLLAGQIYNLVVTRNGNTGYLFINGNQQNSWTDSETYTSNTLKLGTYGGGAGFNLNGNIYAFKAYNRGFSTQEISQNFNAIRGRFGI